LLDFGGKLQLRAGLSPGQINSALQSEAKATGLPITWNYEDVRNKFALTQEQKSLDASNLMEFLVERKLGQVPRVIYLNMQLASRLSMVCGVVDDEHGHVQLGCTCIYYIIMCLITMSCHPTLHALVTCA
jgi:hypothetical protein